MQELHRNKFGLCGSSLRHPRGAVGVMGSSDSNDFRAGMTQPLWYHVVWNKKKQINVTWLGPWMTSSFEIQWPCAWHRFGWHSNISNRANLLL